MTFGT